MKRKNWRICRNGSFWQINITKKEMTFINRKGQRFLKIC